MTSAARYVEFAPRPQHAAAVACAWMRTQHPEDPPTLVLPDACFDFIWSPGNEVMLAAPDTRAVRVPAADADTFVGVRFRPGVGKAVLGIPLSELLDGRITASEIVAERVPGPVRRIASDLLAKAGQVERPDEALRVLTSLGEFLAGAATIDRATVAASNRLAEPRRSCRSLAMELGISERQLNRRMNDEVGYGPKMLQRVLRLQGFLARANESRDRSARPSLTELAVESGYADQAHLNRECADLAGLTPTALLAAR